jgi:hypothetical protein
MRCGTNVCGATIFSTNRVLPGDEPLKQRCLEIPLPSRPPTRAAGSAAGDDTS